MSHIVIGPDMVGRMAIRLGRAYNQGWAQSIERGTPWNWVTATEAIERSTSSRKPIVVEAENRIKNPANTYWDLSPTEARVVFLDKAKEKVGSVQLCEHDNSVSVHVVLDDWADLGDNQVWRIDRAINSLCCGRWQALYSFPPLNWLSMTFDELLPSYKIHLFYSVRKSAVTGETLASINMFDFAKSDEQREHFARFNAAMEKFLAKGGVEKWHKMALK